MLCDVHIVTFNATTLKGTQRPKYDYDKIFFVRYRLTVSAILDASDKNKFNDVAIYTIPHRYNKSMGGIAV